MPWRAPTRIRPPPSFKRGASSVSLTVVERVKWCLSHMRSVKHLLLFLYYNSYITTQTAVFLKKHRSNSPRWYRRFAQSTIRGRRFSFGPGCRRTRGAGGTRDPNRHRAPAAGCGSGGVQCTGARRVGVALGRARRLRRNERVFTLATRRCCPRRLLLLRRRRRSPPPPSWRSEPWLARALDGPRP